MTESIDERLIAGELTWMGVYYQGGQAQQACSAVLAEFRQQYGQDNVILSAAYDKETGQTRFIPGEMGIYVTTAALEAEKALQ